MSVAQRAHLNELAFLRLTAEHMPGSQVDDGPDSFFGFANHPFPFLNIAATIDGTDDPAAFLARAEEFFAPHKAGFVVHTRDGHPGEEALQELCKEREYFEYPRYPEMVVRGTLDEAVPDDVELARVESPQDARTYWDLCNQAYPSIGFPPGTFDAFPDDLLADDRVHAWIATIDGEPAACALGYRDDNDVNFIGWVAAVEKARRRGLGALCTVRAVNSAGAELAALQASPMGESVYRRLGFEEIYNYRLFIKAPPA